jgi:hypothetical protein
MTDGITAIRPVEGTSMKGPTRTALLAALASATAHAHHGIANFDLNSDLEIAGVVTGVEFINPHSWLYLDVAGADGEVTPWRCEMRGATVLRRSGWSPEMFPIGMEITISGSPDRNDPTTCYLGTAVFPDGQTVDRYGQLTKPAARPASSRPARLGNGAPNFAGDWAAEQRVLTDPRGQSGAFLPLSIAEDLAPGEVPEGAQAFPGSRGTAISLADDPVDTYWNQRPSILPLTDAGAEAIRRFDGSSTDNPRIRCEPTNVLFDWTFEMDVNRITQDPDTIRLLYGSMGIERTIHLNMSSHPADIAPSLAGHSIGHWEGDVLVVDTVGFTPGILSADGRLPHSGELHIVERFSIDPDSGALQRSYLAEDRAYFVGQYTGQDQVFAADLPYHGTTPCDDRTLRGTAEQPAPSASPWWMFWKFWD